MKLSKLLRGAPPAREASPPRRRRRAVRPEGPKTIIPIVDEAATPSWLPRPPSTPMAVDLDAARERLRHAIPPVDDDLE